MTQAKVPQKFATLKMLQLRGTLMIAMLVIQFVVGMVLDLFIEMPSAHPGTTGSYMTRVADGFGWAITNGGGAALTLHVAIATILVLGAIATHGFSIVSRRKVWIIASGIGLLGVLSAWLNGIEFINTGLDKHSLAMALAFMIALVSYGCGLYFSKQKTS